MLLTGTLSPERARGFPRFLQPEGSWACMGVRFSAPWPCKALFLFLVFVLFFPVARARSPSITILWGLEKCLVVCFYILDSRINVLPHQSPIPTGVISWSLFTKQWAGRAMLGPFSHFCVLAAGRICVQPPCKHKKTLPFHLDSASEQVIFLPQSLWFWSGEWIKLKTERIWLFLRLQCKMFLKPVFLPHKRASKCAALWYQRLMWPDLELSVSIWLANI